jgi:hypothetical protein
MLSDDFWGLQGLGEIRTEVCLASFYDTEIFYLRQSYSESEFSSKKAKISKGASLHWDYESFGISQMI